MNWIKRAGLKVLSKKLKHKRWMSYVHNDFLIAKCALLHLKWDLGKASVLRKLIDKLYVLDCICEHRYQSYS